MQVGAVIEKGPMDWQIVQQVDGKAEISLSGSWVLWETRMPYMPNVPKELIIPRVFVRVIREDTGDRLISWQPSEDLGSGRWNITIKDIPAGGLYRIETCLCLENGGLKGWSMRGDMIHHIGVGDLYVIAGQSNSAGYGQDPVYDPSEIGVYILRNSGKWDLASHPLNESTNTIHSENREFSNPGHSPYLSFAKLLKRTLGYPIGLLQASLGGSPLSAWNPEENGVLYRNMMSIIQSQGQTIKGMLWYQGCSDAIDALYDPMNPGCTGAGEGLCDTYLDRFKSMIIHLREDLKQKKFPVLTVQLNRSVAPGDGISDRYWGKIREAQRQAAKQIPDVYVIPANDCTLSDFIHNSSASNMILGERLAKMALKKIYDRNVLCDAPDIAKAEKVGKDKIILTFEHIYDNLTMFGVTVDQLPFTIEDEKGFPQIIGYEQMNKNSIVLTINRELAGKCKVHGAFEQSPKPNIPLDFETHLPMLSFYGVEIEESSYEKFKGIPGEVRT